MHLFSRSRRENYLPQYAQSKVQKDFRDHERLLKSMSHFPSNCGKTSLRSPRSSRPMYSQTHSQGKSRRSATPVNAQQAMKTIIEICK